jgi:hypothetical protein
MHYLRSTGFLQEVFWVLIKKGTNRGFAIIIDGITNVMTRGVASNAVTGFRYWSLFKSGRGRERKRFAP